MLNLDSDPDGLSLRLVKRYVTMGTKCVRSCSTVLEDAMAEGTTRFNVLLDERYATKLRRLAERTHLNPGTLARSLLSAALDEANPDSSTIVDLLDSIPGAFERAQQGLHEIRSGKGLPLDEF